VAKCFDPFPETDCKEEDTEDRGVDGDDSLNIVVVVVVPLQFTCNQKQISSKINSTPNKLSSLRAYDLGRDVITKESVSVMWQVVCVCVGQRIFFRCTLYLIYVDK
jgi:hypothetical protein